MQYPCVFDNYPNKPALKCIRVEAQRAIIFKLELALGEGESALPPIPHWLVYASAVVLPLGAFLLTPPSLLMNKLISKFEIHPKLENPQISSVNVYGTELRGRDRDRFIVAFNNADFLFEYGTIPALNKNPIFIRVKQGKRMYEFTAYLYGDGMIQLVRHKGKRQITYRVSSEILELVLQSCIRDAWWVT